ncbi:MAG: sodium:solute symporter family protein [Myxococcota bacterium]|nr:sodium:solute symporter family protein [Myxococcota bacterium]
MDAFIYQYIFGSLVFLAGLYFAYRQGYVGFSGAPLKNLLVLCGGVVFFAALQGWLQYGEMDVAPKKTFQGTFERKKMLGTNLDYVIMVLYFLAILGIGTWFGRKQKSVKDFFFGGQRFSWWLIAFSLVATVVGSYSFVKYSRVGHEYGISSSQTYLNDWFWMPLFWFSWLPLLYFSGISSVPEYFQRRFGSRVRAWVTVFMLIYLIGYVGVNLFTMGTALNTLLGWPVWTAAIVVATISAVYVTFGGQTSVIMTDLFQGVMLLATGALIFWLGFSELGGVEAFWEHLPRSHRRAFANFNEDPAFPSVGIYWQDGFANSAMFYFLNQGVIMRFLAAKDVQEGRKAMFAVPLILMPVAACVVASGGWVGKALEHAGILPEGIPSKEVFFITSELLSRPGVFGLIMASLTAALMSTVDTLITAVAAIAVNDVYKPYFRPNATEKELLRLARVSSITVTLIGVLLVPLYMSFKSIYAAHGAFTAAVTPPLLVTFLLSAFWRRYTGKAALASLVGGMIAVLISVFWPEIITPFAHGVPMLESSDGIFSGAKQYKYMRAFFGLGVSTFLGVAVAFITKPSESDQVEGLVWGTVPEAIRAYKGKPGDEMARETSSAVIRVTTESLGQIGPRQLAGMKLSSGLAKQLGAEQGDLLYVTDSRWWYGGLYSTHGVVTDIYDEEKQEVRLEQAVAELVEVPKRQGLPVRVEKLY